MEYEITGKGERAIIFLHGWGGDYNNFAFAVKALEGRFTCVNVSFFNESEDTPLTLNDYASFVKDIVIKLRLERECNRITVVGHSFGGRVGIRLAVTRLIDSLVLVDSAGLKPRRRLKYILRKTKRAISKILHIKMKFNSPDYEKLDDIGKKTFNNIVNTYQDAEVSEIDVPVLLYWGAKDKDTPLYMAKRFKRKIKDVGLIVIEHGGHYSYLDDYATFIAVVANMANA